MTEIVLTKKWNVPHNVKYPMGSKFMATLLPCTDDPSQQYAMLESGYIIPSGCFDIVPQIPTVEQMVASMNA